MDNNPKKEEDEANKRDYKYVYFIENHIETSQAYIKLPKIINGIDDLQKVKNGILDKGENNKYEYSLYRFSIYPIKFNNIKTIKVRIKLIDKDNIEFENEIILDKLIDDIFLYDIKFSAKIGWDYNKIEPPLSFPFSYDEQFDIYVKYLRKDLNLKQNSNQNKGLIMSSLKLFQLKYNFRFYLMVFLECFSSNFLRLLLLSFKPERINAVGEIQDEKKLKLLLNIIKSFEKKPEKVLNPLKPEEKEKYGIMLFGIILYSTFNYENNRMTELLNNDKEEKKNYIDKALIKYNILFKGLKLGQEHIESLIDKSIDFNEINSSFTYSKDIVELLQIIKNKFEKICEIYKKEETKKKGENNPPKIDINSIITPNKNDNMELIYKLYVTLLEMQKTELNNAFILFDDSFYEQYIYYFNNSNVDNLFYIHDMIKFTRSKFKNAINLKNININSIIHDTGIHLASTGKMKNIEVLNFLSKDEYYNSKQYNNTIYRSLDIFKGIDISSLNDEFFKKWKEINWYYIFSDQYYTFYQIIIDLIKDLNDFNKLFKLCDKSKNDNEYNFDTYVLKLIQEKFLDLYKSYNPKIHLHIKDDLKLLLYYSDKENANIEPFLTNHIQKSLNVELVNEIYIELLSNYGDIINNNTKNIIVKFFLETKDNTNPKSLYYIISNCPKLSKQILQNMNNFCINKNDIFQFNESDNYILFKNLLDLKYFEKEEYKKTEYVQNINKILTEIGKDIEKGEINFNIISPFYDKSKPEDNLEDKLFNILKQISLNDINKAKNYKNIIDNYYKKIKKVIDDLQLIVDDLVIFYEIKEYKNIEEIKNIISEIKKNKLNYYYDQNYTQKYTIFTENYKKNAEERLVKIKSVFFLVIYNNIKKNIKNEDELLKKTEDTFDLLKNIFTKKINLLSKDLLDICLNTVKNKSKEEIDKIIETSAKIFEIKNYNKQEIIEYMIILSRKEDVLKISYAISSFLDKIGSKGELYKQLEKIIENLKNSFEEKIILSAINDLNSFGIKTDILYDEKCKGANYLNILLKLKEQPEALSFLLKKTIDDCSSIQELVGEIDNSFINVNDILDLEQCIIFINKLGNPKELKNKKDIDIIKSFKKEVENSKDKDIEICFNRFVNNYSEIKSLVDYGFDKSEASKKKVLLLCKESKFILTNIKNNFFKCIYKEEIFDKDDQKQIKYNELNLDNLFELRDRIQLTKKITGDKTEKQLLEKYRDFIEKVSKINTIYKLLENIYMYGYPEKIEIVININKGTSTYIGCQLNTKESGQIISKLKVMLEQLKKTQLIAYKYKPLIRFIYGRHFNFLYDILTKKEKDKNKISNFLNYISNKIEKEIDFTYKSTDNNIYEDIINNCEEYINKTLEKNKLTLAKIYEDSLIKKKYKNSVDKGVFLYYCTNLEIKIYQVYKYLTNKNPEAQTVLLCNKETTSEELIAFLYRSILCEFNSCFIIGGVELLEFEKRNIFMETLKELLTGNHEHIKSIDSILIIAYINKDSDIIKSLFSFIKKLDIFTKNEENEIENIKFEKDSKVEIISSDKSGVGKSTQIRLEIEKKKKKYIHFPFGGVFNREIIIERLKNINFSNDSIIHLDLYDTDQIDLMTEFLFSLLITKLYRRNEDFFYFSKDIEIKIEIPNGFIGFIEKIPILSLFSKKKLKIGKLADLIVPNAINSNIQVVANFLWLLKEDKKGDDKNMTADQVDLFFVSITPESYLGPEYSKTVKYARKFSQKECQDLIFNEIKKTIKEPNYYQITSFIDILSTQFKKFNQCFYLNVNTLKERGLEKVRLFILKNFIELTKYFTKGAFNEILESQEAVHKITFGKYDEKDDIDNAMKCLANNKHDIISYDKINPSLLFFHEEDGQGFSFITNKFDDDEYKSLCDFKNTQFNDNNYKIPNYKKFKPEQFLKELRDILNIKNPINDKEKNENLSFYKDKKTLKEIAGSYVFTADNFVKMVLILLRIRANIPVIMMGETGCGKTSLIRKLSEMINNGSNNKMKILNIHAGTTDKDIISFLKNNVIEEAKELDKSEKEKQEELKKKGFIYFPKKIWVFLDEINTCKSMGLITELMCNHSYQGNLLPSNIVFIAACNPYRQGDKNIKAKAGLDPNKAYNEIQKLNDKEKERLKRSMDNPLVYTVNPLPHSLLNFVFDFGNLEKEDEKKYIKQMIKEVIIEDELSYFTTELIFIAQNFIREKNGISSVSLREIRRFIIFYQFFIKYLKIRKETILEQNIKENNNEIIKYSKLNENDIKLYSINLAIYLGYYLRLTDIDSEMEDNNDKSFRKILLEKLNKIFEEKSKNINFLKIPEKEENFIADNVELEKGIAKNRALLENLFSLFVSINTKIPIFILGKPGCSKSLSIQLIGNAMKGNSSNNPFFRKFPKMYVSTYQGSLNSTSEGIKEVFEKAREISKVKENKEKISTFYFDEMGLAEHSPHNPLKVIHSELEYDNNKDEKKIAFLGVSNWSLDSSKMNRGLTINIPDPNEKDIQTTSITIAQSYLGENLDNDIKIFFENLGTCYYKYKQEFRKIKSIKKYENFHGNRDFYHLIKYPATKIKEAIKNNKIIDNKFLAHLSIKGIERNFGGLILNENNYTSGVDLITEKLGEYDNEVKSILKNEEFNYGVKEKIKDNLTEFSEDYLSRYLLLITRTNIGIYLLSSFLKSINGNDNNFDNYTILIGSMFSDDIQKEEYTTKILSKIKMNMEKDTILILKDFESIYPSLYDLFNQNLVKVKGKKYARIALGNRTNSFSEVNKKFRCIIIVDQDKIPEQEIPFLNRFEKYNISFQYLMNDEQILIANKLYENCLKMITYDENKIKLINYDINNLLINCDEEEILGFVYMETQGKKEINDKEYEIIENNFISKLGIILPQDIILILLLNEKDWDDNADNKRFYNKLLDYYNKNIHNNIKSFLSNYEITGNQGNKIIIYTFTNIIESIKNENILGYNIKDLGELKQNNIKQIRISSIQNEYDLETEIEKFFENKTLKIIIIKLLSYECSTIDYFKSIIENKESEYKSKNGEKLNKLFIFIVHLERINKIDLKNNYKENWDLIRKKILTHSLSNLAGYNQIFIDDINGKDYFDNEHKIITLDKILKMKDSDLYKYFINSKNILVENLNSILFFFDYSFYFNEQELNKDIYISKLIKLFLDDEHLLKLIDEMIMKNINNKYGDNNNNNKNILEKVIKEEKFSRGDICIYDIIKKLLNKNYLNEFKILYSEIEKNYFFSSLLFNKNKYYQNNDNKIDDEFNQKIKEIFIQDVDIKNKIPENEMKFEIIIGFNLPSKNIIDEIISNINDNINNQYKENEYEFKNKFFEQEEEFETGKQQYENNLDLYKKITHDNINKNNLIKEIESRLSKGEKYKFYNLLLEDYLLTFIIKNFNLQKFLSNANIIDFIKIILINKFNLNEKNLNLEDISLIFNFIESYSMEIVSIIKMYIFLNSFKVGNELNQKIEEKISEINEKYNNMDIPENIKIINRVFYNTMETLINILIANLDKILLEIKTQENLNTLLDNLNNVYYSLLSINNSLNLSSKEIYILHETIKIISILTFDANEEEMKKNKKLVIDFIQKKIINSNKEKNDLKNKIEGPKLKAENNNNDLDKEIEDTEEEKYLKEHLNKFYDYYKEKNNINFSSLFSSVLFDEFNKEFNEKYRKYILEKILDDDNLIQHNILLIKIILSEYVKPDQEIIEEALDYISSEETYFPLLNQCNKEKVNNNIIKIFDSTINLYFNSLENIEEHIVSDLFDIFKEYLKVISDQNYEKYYNKYCNENLIKIYVLSYIKIYLNNFVNLLCDKKNALKEKEQIIIEEITKESSISNTIMFYFIILMFNKTNSLDILKDETYKDIEAYSNNLQNEIGQNNFDNILNDLLIPKEDKYLFNEFFNYVKYPTLEDFESKFLSSKENQEKYPLINEFIKKDSGSKNLKYLNDYNDFINLMINYYSGKISRNDANNGEKSLNLEEI